MIRFPKADTDEERDVDSHLRIGEVAEATGLTQRTIRYYEELGLLPPPTRTHSDYRLYSPGAVTRLQEIIRLKDLLGFSLAEIKEIAEAEEIRSQLHAEYHATDDVASRLLMLGEATKVTTMQLGLVERKMAQMAQLRTDLTARLARYEQRRSELATLDKSRQEERG